ncbi:MAG: lytic murein transglycosylase B [Pseudomonadota bacterium]
MLNFRWIFAFVIALTPFIGGAAFALDTDRPDVAEFIDEMVEQEGFSRAELTSLLAGAKSQTKILEAMRRPAEKSKPWHEYRDIFIQDKRIDAGVAFWDEHADTIARISEETGVPGEILVGIIGVETYYGRITGSYRVLDALATLGFDYPPRAKFFRKELKEFLLLAREESVPVDAALGSYAGAMGSPQFIPSSYRAYSVDADADGRRDLFNSWTDIIGSVANYFVRHRWESGAPVIAKATLDEAFSGQVPEKNTLKADSSIEALRAQGVTIHTTDELAGQMPARLIAMQGEEGPIYHVGLHNFYVITRYNRSAMYAMAVWELGTTIAARRDDQRRAMLVD